MWTWPGLKQTMHWLDIGTEHNQVELTFSLSRRQCHASFYGKMALNKPWAEGVPEDEENPVGCAMSGRRKGRLFNPKVHDSQADGTDRHGGHNNPSSEVTCAIGVTRSRRPAVFFPLIPHNAGHLVG